MSHTSAQQQQQPSLLPEPMARFTGVLIAHGQARMKQLDSEGHMVPVLVLDIELDGALHNHLHAEQLFGVDQQQACEAAAHRYRKGVRVTVDAPVIGLRMVATNTTHIHVHKSDEEQTA